MKERLIRWLIGPHHTVVHNHLIAEYEKLAKMTPMQFRLYYDEMQMKRQFNRFVEQMNADLFANHKPLATRLGSLREYMRDKHAKG